MLDKLQEYAAHLNGNDVSLLGVFVAELAKQDQWRMKFATFVLDNVWRDKPDQWLTLFLLGLQAGYTRQEIVVLAAVEDYEEMRFLARVKKSDAVWIEVFRKVDAAELEALAVWRQMLLICGVLKMQVDSIRWYKAQYDGALNARNEERRLFRDSIDASLLTPDELMEYISSKMTVIPARLLNSAGPELDNLTLQESPSSSPEDEEDEWEDD